MIAPPLKNELELTETLSNHLMEAEVCDTYPQRGHVVSRKWSLEQVWGLKEDTDTRAIANFLYGCGVH